MTESANINDGQNNEHVFRAYQILLGRDPESSAVVEHARKHPATALTVGILGSGEFLNRVVHELLVGGQVPQALRSKAPSAEEVAWTAASLGLPDDAIEQLRAARNWSLFLIALLGIERIGALVPGLAGQSLAAQANAIQDILDREAIHQLTDARDVIGLIDGSVGSEITGWAVNRADLQESVILEILANGVPVGTVKCSQLRRDIQDRMRADGLYGFRFSLPIEVRDAVTGELVITALDLLSRTPISGKQRINLTRENNLGLLEQINQKLGALQTALDEIRRLTPQISTLTSAALSSYDLYHHDTKRMTPSRRRHQQERIANFAYRPLISIITPTWNSDPRLFEEALQSVLGQSYENWELLLSDDGSDSRLEVKQVFDRVLAADPRAAWLPGEQREGVSAATNRGLDRAEGDYICFLDHDDELSEGALYHVVSALQAARPRVLYSDEDRSSYGTDGRKFLHTPFFKPDFDIDLLRGQNYMCHLVAMERGLARRLGGLNSRFDGAQDHDFLLRAAETVAPEDIFHIPEVLYHWHVNSASISRDEGNVTTIETRILSLVDEHLSRIGAPAKAAPAADPFAGSRSFTARVAWQLPSPAPPVSIIIPSRDRPDLLGPCLSSLLMARRNYPGEVEIVIVDNDSQDARTRAFLLTIATQDIKVIPYGGPFNWSAINNHAVERCAGAVLVFLNNDTVMKERFCINALAAQALRPEVGAVGGRLLYEDGSIQHAGVILGQGGIAGHEGIGLHVSDPGYFGRQHLTHQVSAVTGACLATRRELFDRLGGFDEASFKVAFNDVDYCLRVRKAGLAVIYDPAITLYHFESKSRGFDTTPEKRQVWAVETSRFVARWPDAVTHDPFYNRHFDRLARPFTRLRIVETADEEGQP